jgi:hypothetical protein
MISRLRVPRTFGEPRGLLLALGHADVIDIPVVPREPIRRVVVGRVLLLLPSSQLAALANHGYLARANECRPEAAKGALTR